jgi:hypothetical protein
MRRLIITVAALAATGGLAMAETAPQQGWLTLSAPAAKDHIVFDGAVWRCKAEVCQASQVKSLPPLRSCKRLARELGPVTSFGYRGVVLSADQLAACNPVGIAKTPAASELAASR